VHHLRFRCAASVSAAVILALPWAASAALTGTQACLIAKHKATGKDQACLLKALASATLKSTTFDSTTCDGSLQKGFTSAEYRYTGDCRTIGDASTLASRGADLASALETLLGIGSAAPDQLACIAAKLKVAGHFASCIEKAETQLIAKDLLFLDETKCAGQLAAAVTKSEAGGTCPAGADALSIRGAVDAAFRQGEADLANLGTADFAALGPFHTSQRLLTFVDTTRSTPANGSYAGAPTRTLDVVINYPVVDNVTAFPLVVRAHGFSGFNGDSTDLMKHLASRGAIVVSPNFPLSNLNAPGGVTLLDLDQQIVDVSFVIDSMLALGTTPGNFFEGMIDASRIGIVGHSLGGATVIGTGYHPTLADPRVKAVVALAPLACMYEHQFYTGGTAPLMILSGTADLVTLPTSNHLAAYNDANPEKYLVSLDGGLHIGFSNDFVQNDSINADDSLACPSLIPPGSPRPVALTVDIPPGYLGGAADGFDTTASACEPICPLPGPTWMAHNRQRDIELAATSAMLERVFWSSGPADRMLTQKLDSENGDVAVTFAR
jgi:dienelactone hydrolase